VREGWVPTPRETPEVVTQEVDVLVREAIPPASTSTGDILGNIIGQFDR